MAAIIQVAAIIGAWKYIKLEINATTQRSLENKEAIIELLATDRQNEKAEKDYREEQRQIIELDFRAVRSDIKRVESKLNQIDKYLRNEKRS